MGPPLPSRRHQPWLRCRAVPFSIKLGISLPRPEGEGERNSPMALLLCLTPDRRPGYNGR
jgi:hypothetical protein